MSLQELKFYKCKLCKEADLIAGKYCIVCAKKDKVDKALNTKRKSPGYPFIDPTLTPPYDQEFTGTFAGSNTLPTSAGTCTTVATTDFPVWNNFTAGGNATTNSGTFATVSSGTAMDLGFVTNIGYRQNPIQSKRKKNRHK